MQSAVIVPVVLNANGVVSILSCDNLPHYCSAFISFKFNLGFLLSAMMAEQCPLMQSSLFFSSALVPVHFQ